VTATAPAELAEEDAARASLYALIGRLFFDAPDAALLAQIARDSEQADAGSPLGAAYLALGAACRNADVAALAEEHLTLFGGVGRALVTPYTSAYVIQSLHERHLLALRLHLAALGLSRTAAATDPEDHVAGLCDAMRHLILRHESDQTQEKLFNQYMYLTVKPLCEKVIAAKLAQFYKEVARFALAFLEVEREGFEMLQ
jgi:TorA maturation chaperone TorD